MRQGQAILVEMRGAVEQQVEVEGARRVAEAALAAVAVLDVEQCGEQGARCELGLDLRHRVDEVGLVDVADRRRRVQAGAGDDAGAGQAVELGERVFHLRRRVVEVGAQADGREDFHAGWASPVASPGFLRLRRRRGLGPVSGFSIVARSSSLASWKRVHHSPSSASTSPDSARSSRKS